MLMGGDAKRIKAFLVFLCRRKLRGLPGLPAWSPRYFKNTIQSALDMLLPLPRYLAAAGDIENLAAGEGCMTNSGLRKVGGMQRTTFRTSVHNTLSTVAAILVAFCP